jgi:addiction module HigA family antidote
MKTPSHPGSIVRHECLDPLGLSVTDAAKVLRVTRQTLNNLVNGKAGVSAEMAVRLSKAFGSEPEFWLRLQMNYDLAEVRHREAGIDVKRFKKAS